LPKCKSELSIVLKLWGGAPNTYICPNPKTIYSRVTTTNVGIFKGDNYQYQPMFVIHVETMDVDMRGFLKKSNCNKKFLHVSTNDNINNLKKKNGRTIARIR